MRIEAYYNGIKNANNAVDQFKSAGFNDSAVDLNDKYIDFENYTYNFSDAITSSHSFSNSSYIPNNVGDGMGSLNDVLNSNYKVVINTDSDEKIDRLKTLIYETGGIVSH
ncbi:hypothetical protein KM800_09175 [Clostridium tyrobutyricum]|uniref:hypothetical protein n=1 Tax=Clostridium tyrobutyricum TaxID=1519 RepID=UPI001C395518|nr:hypothetical protein [Clostridium tyrobutyricum]MBV4419503.1 hypothetical protein [Clostridium tyrobutyricum]